MCLKFVILSLPLFFQEVHANHANLTEFQRRLTEMYLLEARLNGVELVGSDRKRFMETLKRLSVERSNFRWDK